MVSHCLLRRFDRPTKGEVRASAKHVRLVMSLKRKGPWERKKRRGKAFFSSLCALRALVPQIKRDVWERGRVSQLFLQGYCLFTAGTCKIHCFNLTGRKMKKATNSRTAKKNNYPAVILCLQRIW